MSAKIERRKKEEKKIETEEEQSDGLRLGNPSALAASNLGPAALRLLLLTHITYIHTNTVRWSG